MLLETALQDEGCQIVGPFARIDEALRAAGRETVDAALLDVNLAGEMIFPVAELLDRRGVPFLLLSGYGDQILPSDRMHWPVCSKPFRVEHVLASLASLLAVQPGAAGA